MKSMSQNERRKLIVDFFTLGVLERCQICFLGGWLSSEDVKTYQGQELWALAFERAERENKLDKMREYVDIALHNT